MNGWVQKYGVLIALGLLFTISSIWKPETFLGPQNLINILNQNSFVGMVAIGMTLVIILGGIDLSVGSVMAFVGTLAVFAVNRVGGDGAVPVLVGLGACLAVGAAIGWVNGALVTLGGLAPFVATLGGLAAYRSLALVMGNAGAVTTSTPSIGGFGLGGVSLGPVTLTWNILIFLGLAVAATILLDRTAFGRHVVAVGANEKAAHYAAVSVDRVKRTTYMLCGLTAGLAGFCTMARMSSVSTPQMGMMMELDAIAAVAIGGTAMAGGFGRIWGTVAGVLLLGIITNMMTLAEINVNWQGFVKGAIIVLAVLVQRGRRTA